MPVSHDFRRYVLYRIFQFHTHIGTYSIVRVLDFVRCFIFSKPYMNISLKIEYQSGIIETQSVAKADN